MPHEAAKKYLACIAHDRMKESLIECLSRYKDALRRRSLIATGTTGHMIRERLGLAVKCMRSGPLGGDQQIGSEIAFGNVGAVIFLRDPLFAHPHEPDIAAFLRLCDVHRVPLATNVATAECLLDDLDALFGETRQMISKPLQPSLGRVLSSERVVQ